MNRWRKCGQLAKMKLWTFKSDFRISATLNWIQIWICRDPDFDLSGSIIICSAKLACLGAANYLHINFFRFKAKSGSAFDIIFGSGSSSGSAKANKFGSQQIQIWQRVVREWKLNFEGPQLQFNNIFPSTYSR
jgi:hypothetical protein